MDFEATRSHFVAKEWKEMTDTMKCNMGNTKSRDLDVHYANGECGELRFTVTGPDRTQVELMFKGALKAAGFTMPNLSYPEAT